MGCAGSSAKDAHDGHRGHGGEEDDGAGGEEDYNPLTEDEVNARIVCCPKPELFPLGETGITLRYAYLSQRGYYPEDLYKANQDAFKVIPKFDGKKEQIFFGVFDGHGVDGDSCSYFVSQILSNWNPAFIEKDAEALQHGLKKCLEDSSAETRSFARGAFPIFQSHWPQRAKGACSPISPSSATQRHALASVA